MVCLGNICRSPIAEGLMQEKIERYALDATVDSAGFESFHINDTPDYRSISVMNEHGIDISSQRMRLFRLSDFEHFDRIYIMDSNNFRDVKTMARNEKDIAKVDYILNVLQPGSNLEVPDPYYGGVTGFEKVYQMLDKATEKIASEIKMSQIIK
jgi:protein-tyrosine phosphatase